MIIIFLLVISALLYLANVAVYEAVLSIFSIPHSLYTLWFGLFLGILSGSFIFATFLGYKLYNRFSRAYYIVSAVWMGFFCYAFFASAAYGVLVFLPISKEAASALGMFLLCIAFCVALYGFFHARKIIVKDVTVLMPSLPPLWLGRTAVWTSDIHLGQLHGPAFAAKVADRINALSPDIIFIGGDLFDGTGAPDIPELMAPLQSLAPALGTYFVTGNHEELEKSDVFVASIKALGITVLEGESIDIDGVKIIGIGHGRGAQREGFAQALSGLSIDPKKPSILLKHEPRDLDIAEKAGISFQISGHTHRAQMWPLNYIARMIYKGHEYGLKPYGNMHVYTSSGTGSWGPPLRVGSHSEIVRITFRAFEPEK